MTVIEIDTLANEIVKNWQRGERDRAMWKIRELMDTGEAIRMALEVYEGLSGFDRDAFSKGMELKAKTYTGMTSTGKTLFENIDSSHLFSHIPFRFKPTNRQLPSLRGRPHVVYTAPFEERLIIVQDGTEEEIK